ELFPQDYVIHADNWQEVKDHCGAIVPLCGETLQFQTDYYSIDSAAKAQRLDTLLTQGVLTYGVITNGSDDGFLLKHDKSWTLIETVGDECEPVLVDYCVWDSEQGQASK